MPRLTQRQFEMFVSMVCFANGSFVDLFAGHTYSQAREMVSTGLFKRVDGGYRFTSKGWRLRRMVAERVNPNWPVKKGGRCG